MLVLCIHLVCFMIIDLTADPFQFKPLKNLQSASMLAISCLLLAEMAITSDLHYTESSTAVNAVSLFLIALPQIVFYGLLI
jgi:hypothetical protein